MDRLRGGVSVVTGGARGIGEAIVRLFAQEGSKIVIVDINEQGKGLADEITRGGKDAYFVRADVSRSDDVKDMVQQAVGKYGKIDVLVNNAGITGGMDNGLEVEEEIWQKVIDIDLTAVHLCTKYVGLEMIKRQSGSIVNMSSMLGIIGSPYSAPYHAAKGGVRTYTKAMAIALAPYKIRVNSIHPGYIETEMVKGVFADLDDPSARSNIESLHPLGRLGRPEEVAFAALFLACDESSFITGEELLVDGGFTAQ